MSAVLAHLGCAALLSLDLAARTERLRLLALGAGRRMTSRDALQCNLLADAGAAITPMRLGGEPARVAGMRLAGVSLPVTLATIGWELIASWPVLVLVGAGMIATCAPGWWQAAGPHLARLGAESRPALTIVLAMGILAAVLAAQLRKRIPPPTRTAVDPLRIAWRSMPLRTLLASVPLTAINIGCRTAMLPMLAMTMPTAPDAAPLWFGSFLLVYGQLFFPTPAGVGAVEIAFLGGAAGALAEAMPLLLAWRWWSSLLPALLGGAAAWQFQRRMRAARQRPA